MVITLLKSIQGIDHWKPKLFGNERKGEKIIADK